jgi:hypothetical protein
VVLVLYKQSQSNDICHVLGVHDENFLFLSSEKEMKFTVKENGANQIKEEDKKSYTIWSLTINPNITQMDEKELQLFRLAGQQFFNDKVLPKYIINRELIEEIRVEYGIEKGNKKKSDHLQVAIEICAKKGGRIKFDLEKMNEDWNKMIRHYFGDRGERKVYIHVRVATDYVKTLRQYCNKM